MLKKINVFIICLSLLLLISCASSYKLPSKSNYNFILDYNFNTPGLLKSDIPLTLLPAIIVDNNGELFELNPADKEAMRNNPTFSNSVNSLIKDLELVINKNDIVSKVKDDILLRIKTILKNKGFNNIISTNKGLSSLNYDDIIKSKIAIQPIISINQKITDPDEMELFGKNEISTYYARRSRLFSHYEMNIDVKFYEPFTETFINNVNQDSKKNISDNFDFFIDTFWTWSGMKLIVYKGFAFTNHEEKFGMSISSKYQDLLKPLDDKISKELVENVYSDCADIQSKYIPSSINVQSNFSFKPYTEYKKLKNVYAVMIESDSVYSSNNILFNSFNSSLTKQLMNIFSLRGVDILDKVTDTENMVYSDKMKSYFAIKFENKIKLGIDNIIDKEKLGKLLFKNHDMDINGEIIISIYETMTKEKLLEKSITIVDKIKDLNQVLFSGAGRNVKLYDNSDEILLNLLEKNYDKICNYLWTILSPNSISEIKNNVNEIRRRVGFPIIN